MAAKTHDIILTSLLFLLLLSTASAQSSPSPPPQYVFTPSTATIIIIVLATIFFIGFFSLYLRLCSEASGANPLLSSLHLRAAPTGLDAAALNSLPVILYSEIKDHKLGKGALECAICLNEFEDDEALRLIPKCDHVFHPDCINAWLELHVTCPVCRADLASDPDNETKTNTDSSHHGTVMPLQNPDRESISVSVIRPGQVSAQDENLGRRTSFLENFPRLTDQDESLGRKVKLLGKFSRSHSTGHSIVVVSPGECTERFTLRLPDHIRKEVLTRALTRAATFNITEGSTRRGRRVGEGSSRGARSYKRLDRAVKSDRWVITMPFSGEGSTGRGNRTAVKLPSFKCLGPRPSTSDDGTDLVNVGPVRAAV